MANGYTGKYLRVDLTSGSIETHELEDRIYRTYFGGGALGLYFLCQEGATKAEPLSPENVLVIAPGVTTGAPVSGVSRCCLSAISPATGAVGDSQAGGSIGPLLKRAGYDAVVIVGRAADPSYLLIETDRVELRSASQIWGKPTVEAHHALVAELGGDKNLSILQCGPAGEKLVRFACVLGDGHDVFGRTGMGAVMGSKNLRAVAVRGNGSISFADPKGFKALNKKAAQRLPDAGFPTALRDFGTPGVVNNQAGAGNFATHNHSRGFHPEHTNLDGSAYQPEIGAGATTCYGCVVRCRKKVKAEEPYPLTDELGGPELETLSVMGTNLEVTSAAAVARASQLCGQYGIDTLTMGGLAAYVFECVEHGLIPEDRLEGQEIAWGNAEALFWLIEKTAAREGIGDVLADGFKAAIAEFGARTAPYAMQVKNQGLALHMPQVKPSQALMYAVCPIGPDHQSSEHDWLATSPGEDRKGLGIINGTESESFDIDKVRMTAYSQYYYSMMDALCLCMFCWGPGSLFTYQELEELLRCATGWDCTLWELMKAGERRINLMRQINAERGFHREHDALPERMFEPLPDGPSEGRRVDPDLFPKMLETYYRVMGWDPETGNPSRGKLEELGLDWML